MNRLVILLFVLPLLGFCQDQTVDSLSLDDRYREDQFYVGVTYNLLGNKPKDLSQNGFSSGFNVGFIRDIPINKRRNVAIGIGLGYSGNSFNQNMLINKDEAGKVSFSIIDEEVTSFSKNKFAVHMVELPFELRWRTSTAEKYNFWRIYTGLKVGYVFAHSTKFKGDLGRLKYSDIQNFNELQYGLTFSVGYNTWNAHLYYALNPIFDNAYLENTGERIDMKAVKIGVIFYIL